MDRSLWEAAQELRARRSMYKLELGPSPNVLLGLLFDGHGRRMTIAEDTTKGTRYRYYISDQARWAGRQGLVRLRVEASRLEALVVAAVTTALRDRRSMREVLVVLGRYDPSIERMVEAGPAAAVRLERAAPERLRLMLVALLARVEINKDEVRLLLRCREVARFLLWNGVATFRRDPAIARDDDRVHVLVAPASVRSGKGMVIPLACRKDGERREPSTSLSALVMEARRAQRTLDEERDTSVTDIAARFRRQPGIFARLVRLNYLAPDIVAAILDGAQPAALTRRKLLYADLPMDWPQQRALLGFPPIA